MNRAQEIRKKQLAERKAAREKKKEDLKAAREKKKKDLKVAEAEAKEMYDWVLDLLEEPTKYNQADEVWLNDTECHKIQIGCHAKGEGLTEKKFNQIVMRKVVKMFNAEKGYTSKYFARSYGIPDGIVVRIK